MDVILVSGRHPVGDRRSQVLAADMRLAVGLRAQDCDVRWICPSHPHENGVAEAAALDAGIELLPAVSRVPPFRSVMARLSDRPTELVFTKTVRERLPDMVHALDFGGTTSANIAWLCRRLGTPCTVSVGARQALCHRGTLINERQQACTEWDQPKRCLECCLTPYEGGLGSGAAACGRLLARWRVLSPFPDDLDFDNRLETVIASLADADLLLLREPGDLEHLQRAGLGVAMQCLGSEPEAAEVLRCYQQCLGRTVAAGS